MIFLARCFAAVTSSRPTCTCRTRQIVKMKKKNNSSSIKANRPPFPCRGRRINTALQWEAAAAAADVLNVQPASSGTWRDFCFDTLWHVRRSGAFVVRLHVMWLLSLLVVMLRFRGPDGGVCRIKLAALTIFSSFLKRCYLRARKRENFCNERGNLASGIIVDTATQWQIEKKWKKGKFEAVLNTTLAGFIWWIQF